jgi:hypothetical protein
MSDQPGRESIDTDLGSYSVDDEDQLESEDTLIGSDATDDEPYSPPDQQPRGTEWGTTPAEQEQGESIEQRIKQEQPDPDTAYGAPDNEGGLDQDPRDRVGGDDPDSIAAEDDWLGDSEVGDEEAGQIVQPDEGVREDVDKELYGEDEGPHGSESAEESAMHDVEEE